MKTYTEIERTFNIINRANQEFNFMVDLNEDLATILGDASDILLDNIEYDRISVAEMSNSHSVLYWSDEMGYFLECSGDFLSGRSENFNWYRFNERTKDYDPIKWYDATENDYVEVHRAIDSKGDVVLLLAK